MTEHTLRTWSPYWDAVASGDKNFEVRRDDRGFQKGDILILQKYDPQSQKYEMGWACIGDLPRPKEIRKRVSYVLSGGRFGIEPGYVVMGLVDA